MKPVVIFRHAKCEDAGYLGAFLDANGIPWTQVRTDLDEVLPSPIDQYSGLVLMGGPMSANDDLPWIIASLQLIREAVSLDIPVLGHCLGGQLMTRALGGEIIQNAHKELGWGQVQLTADPLATHWFGKQTDFLCFHWHGETFSIPEGATLLLSSDYCTNQAWAMGKHLAMQCHIEMTEKMVGTWCEAWQEELATSSGAAVQSAAEMQQDLPARIQTLNQVADHVYGRWIQGLKK